MNFVVKCSKPILHILTIASAIGMMTLGAHACDSATKKNEHGADLPESPASADVGGQKGTPSALDVKVDLRSDGILTSIGGAPAQATLECRLNEKALNPCHDGAVYVRPMPGDYKISVVALVDGTIVASGESAKFTILPGDGNYGIPTDDDPMSIALDQESFKNGDTVTLGKDFSLSFKTLGTPDCDAVLMCSYDSRYTAFWNRCFDSADQKSFVIPAEMLATGLQYLSIQARCAEKVGPTFHVFWWGVPKDYQPLMLRVVKDSDDRQIVNLIKADDCPDDDQKLECADANSDEYSLCTGGNVFDAPAKGSKVRLTCGTRVGPSLTF